MYDISPEDLRKKQPEYNKDKDMVGYMYLFDTEIMDEELKFEELLTRVYS